MLRHVEGHVRPGPLVHLDTGHLLAVAGNSSRDSMGCVGVDLEVGGDQVICGEVLRGDVVTCRG